MKWGPFNEMTKEGRIGEAGWDGGKGRWEMERERGRKERTRAVKIRDRWKERQTNMQAHRQTKKWNGRRVSGGERK